MSDRPMLPLTEPPDLLRRFEPTPYEAIIRSGDLRVQVRTNDARLLRLADKLDDAGSEAGRAEWTIVCDEEMPPHLEDPLVLDGERTSFLSFGRACYVAIDHGRKQVTGFMSAGISDEEWSGVVLPAVLKLIAERWQ